MPLTDFCKRMVVPLTLLATVLVFLADWLTPVALAAWGLYVAPLLMIYTWGKPQWLLPGAGFYTLLIFLGLLTPISSPDLPILAVNRLLGVTAIWILCYYLSLHRQTEESLRLNLTKYTVLFDTAPVGISIADSTGKIVETNRQAEEILGLPHQEHEARTLADSRWRIVRPDGSPMPPDEFASIRALREGRRIDNVQMGVAKDDGSVTWLSVTSAPLPLPQSGVITVFADINAWRSAQQALAASEQRLRYALDAISDGVWDWNVQTGALTYSETWLNKYGYSKEEAAPHISFWESIVHPDDAPMVQQALADHFAGKTPVYECENRLRTKGGEYRYNLDRGRVVQWDEQGRPLRMVGADTDVTERVQNEQARAQLAAIVESSENAILSNDLRGIIASWNRSAARLCGYTAAEAIGQGAAMLFGPERQEEMASILACIQAGKVLNHYETEHIDRSGKRMLMSLAISPVCDRSGRITGTSMIARDVTEQKALEQAVRDLNSDLEQRVQERTAALESALEEVRRADQLKEAFLAAVSHELRTPLTGVLGVADALEQQVGGPLNARQMEQVQILQRSGKRLLEMINGILHYTKLLAGQTVLHRERVKLADVGVRCIRKIQVQADRKQLAVHCSVKPPDLEMESDAEGLAQLLHNLLDNAIKFTPAGGAVGLEMRRTEGSQIEMVVWDTGIGIGAEQQARIFDAFMQVDGGLARHYEGVGLGLAYAQRMAALLGGECSVQSAPGQGSRFTVTLPAGSAE